jgi:flagellin-like protein
MKKKGISPLIATVLIIGFTVALAAIIITWSTGFTKRMQTQTEETANVQIICSTDVVFGIKSVCYEDEAAKCTGAITPCYKVLIQNDGKEDITGWKIRVYQDANTVKAFDKPESVDAFGIVTVDVLTSDITGLISVRQIEAFPVITRSNKDIICSQNTDTYGDASGSVIDTAC